MPTASGHTFYNPVMGFAFTIDTPVNMARYGISSVISIVDDILLGGIVYYTQLASDPATANEFKISFSPRQRETEQQPRALSVAGDDNRITALGGQ